MELSCKYSRGKLFSSECLLLHVTKQQNMLFEQNHVTFTFSSRSEGLGGGQRGHGSPSTVKISHKKDGHQRQPHIFCVFRPFLCPTAGSTTDIKVGLKTGQYFVVSNIFSLRKLPWLVTFCTLQEHQSIPDKDRIIKKF